MLALPLSPQLMVLPYQRKQPEPFLTTFFVKKGACFSWEDFSKPSVSHKFRIFRGSRFGIFLQYFLLETSDLMVQS